MAKARGPVLLLYKPSWWCCWCCKASCILMSLCLSVCLSTCTTWKTHGWYCLLPWLNPPLIVLQYVKYFRLCWWRHVFIPWARDQWARIKHDIVFRRSSPGGGSCWTSVIYSLVEFIRMWQWGCSLLCAIALCETGARWQFWPVNTRSWD